MILPSKLSTMQAHTQMPSLLWQTLDESLFNIAEFFLGVERKWYRICRASQKICCTASADRVERGFRRLPSPNASFNRWENWDPKGSSGFSQSPRASWSHPKLTASAPHQVRTILPPPLTRSLLRNSKSYRVKTKVEVSASLITKQSIPQPQPGMNQL